MLGVHISVQKVELVALKRTSDETRALEAAEEYLHAAERSWKSTEIETAWSHLYRAREQLIEAYPATQVSAMARALCEEIQEDRNIAPWRVRAVREILKHDIDSAIGADDNVAAAGRRQRLCQAAKIRDEGQTEVFVRLTVHRHFQLYLLALGIPIVAGTIWLVAINARNFSDAGWKSGSAVPCLLAVMFGVVGALVSTAQRSSRINTVTIADYMQLLAASCSRIPIGGVAGVTVWLFSVAAVGDDAAGLSIANMLIAAFGAGFAERLVVQGANADKDDRR